MYKLYMYYYVGIHLHHGQYQCENGSKGKQIKRAFLYCRGMHCIHVPFLRNAVLLRLGAVDDYTSPLTIEERFNQKTRQRSSLLFRGQNFFNSLPRLLCCLGLCERKGRIHPIFLNRPR